jgi:hypothetical protein
MRNYGGGGAALSNADPGARMAGKGVAKPDGKLADGRGFLLIISGFVEILGRHPGFIQDENNRPRCGCP